MLGSQPDLEMGKGTGPVKDLDDESKCKARQVKYLDRLILDSPEAPQKKENNPEKMNEYNSIRKDLVEHRLVYGRSTMRS